MAILHNEITINAPAEKIWQVLATPDLLEKYDPTVRKSTLISEMKTDLGAKRKVDMKDGKNWFEEVITVYDRKNALTYELTACSFPVHRLKHSYRFQESDGRTRVLQTMEYTVKFGIAGKLLDLVMIRRQSDTGIKKFFAGLKSYMEKQ
jgi:ligand-binding SRPBCC domain-containing protein